MIDVRGTSRASSVNAESVPLVLRFRKGIDQGRVLGFEANSASFSAHRRTVEATGCSGQIVNNLERAWEITGSGEDEFASTMLQKSQVAAREFR
jgi:hypothetical protein